MFNSLYNGNSVSDYLTDSKWMGGHLNAIQIHGGTAGWNDWLTSVTWQADMFAKQDVQIMWSIPLIPWGATLEAAGAGKYSDKYLAMAKQLAADGAGDDKIYVRLGWEFNGAGWNSSSAVGQPENYIKAYQEFVNVARSVSDKFVFEWCPNIGATDMNPETAYPGDKYVDIVGLDMYYNVQWDSKNAAEAFKWFVNEPYGLKWQQDFAKAHGKATAIGEWGLNVDSPEFVKLAMQWFADHDMVYQNYWNSNAAFAGELSSGQYRNAASAFLQMLESASAPTTISSDVDRTLAGKEVVLTLTGSAVTGIGNALDNTLTGNAMANVLNGLAGNDKLYGGAGNDKLYGGDGNDRLDGGVGADAMDGGTGNDVYVVDHSGDKVTELANAGLDTVEASIDYTLGNFVENLTLTGTARIANGNALDNVITGNAGDNTLNGNAGNDTLIGGAGNDLLSGGSGNDTMMGGTGNDVYYVQNVGDIVIENAGEGTDTVYASVDYTLTANVETLYMSGTASLTGIGNALANQMYGNNAADTLYGMDGDDQIRGFGGDDKLYGGAGNDRIDGNEGNDFIDGGTGADTMQGDAGNDTYIVDNLGDVVTEFSMNGQGGIDTVYASVDFTLGNNVENLYLTGSAVKGTGNALNNVIQGNALANVLNGGGGNDILTGGAGGDRFVFTGASGKDTITDFGSGDVIDLSGIALKQAPAMTQVGHDVLIDLGGGNSILLTDMTTAHVNFTGSGFGFV